ncbi:MAG: lamin tail domain-containing protein, partial [Phycisphaerae bacterium]|nr:lamin tail domain-containing protein [Phycisphaerae bacterium]
MAQGTGSHRTSPTHRRRGTVLILVISVLAMLFILGTSQLMMARYARKLADERATGTQAKDTVASSVVPTADGVAADVRGTDFVPYNSSWNRALNNGSWSVVEQPGADNSADFPGYVDHRDVPNNPNYNSLLSPAQDRIRNGDLLLSSLEPYQTNVNGSPGWAYFAMTWSQNTPATSSLPPAPFTVSGASTSKSAPLANPALGSFYDVSGSGVFDGQQVGSMASCDLYQRVICHGGMVLLDRMTHPSLLKQVIHPNDGYANQPWALFGLGVWNGIKYNKSNPQDPTNGLRDDGIRAADEGRMRRRFMLPGSEIVNSDAWKNLPLGDLRTLLPYTLGYLAPSGDQYGPKDEKGNYLPHYWRVGSPPAGVNMSAQAEKDWYESRIVPGPAMNENYVAANDTYDRRHLITMFSNDDLLRPNRDEMGLFLNPSAAVPTWLRPFYYLIAPTATAERDSSFGSYAGFTTQTPTFTSDPANGIRVPAYGMVGDTLLFNTPGLRTQFSLRDVLVSPVSNSVVVEDPTYQNSDNPFWLPPDTYGAQASYKRAMQLTAYYLAMLQHTAQGVDRSATPWTPLMLSPEEQLRQAAQLAVNTIDFADSDSIPTKLVIKYLDAMGAEQTITVLGVEKQPYITEIYAKVAEVYDPDGKKRPDPDFPSRDASIHAVEIYNPYDTQISLRGYKLVSNGKPYPLKDLKDSNGTTPHDYIAPHSVLILSNQDASWSDSTGSNLPFDGNATSVATGEFVIKVDADFKVGAVTQLINTQALQLDATSVNPIFKTGEAIIVDQININAA